MSRARGGRFRQFPARRSKSANRLIRLLGAGSAGFLLMAGEARAQTPPDGERPASERTGSVEAPRLLKHAEAEYPEAARAARIEAVVRLKLLVDAEGRVASAEVVTPQGHGFDEAATRAALELSFAPATVDGKPVAAKILYDYVFRAVDAAPPPAAPPPLAAGGAVDAPPPPARDRPARPARAAAPIEVVVKGASEADRLRRSAMPIEVIETERARRESASLGEVLSRSPGVAVTRAGGLGSRNRLELNGLTDGQIRVFLDGIPLEAAGFGNGVGDVPVNAIERAEVYAGVVPIRFGADALGGAINLVTDHDVRGTHAGASYQVGSFATYRATIAARHRHEPSGLVVNGSGFVDYAANNYPIDVQVDVAGEPRPARVHRFHDGYRALGGNVEFGVVDRPWAKRLLLRLFSTSFEKELQHNVGMTVPYGEVVSGESAQGGTLRYEKRNLFVRGLAVSLTGGYTHRRIDFKDTSRWVYDWYGRRTYERPAMSTAGEVGPFRSDLTQWEHRALGRLHADIYLADDHALHITVAPSDTRRTGKERLRLNPSRIDPLTTRREVLTLVSGVEYQAYAAERRFENILFAKDYLYWLSTDQVETFDNSVRPLERATHRLGIGDGLVFQAAEWLSLKGAYELATRLPQPEEVFGDGALLSPNLELAPETSHNATVSATLAWQDTPAGAVRGTVQGFVRHVDDMIARLPSVDRLHEMHENIATVRSVGVEGSLGWTSPGELVSLEGNVTWMDLRNISDEGAYKRFAGERLPNRPWLFANATAGLRFAGVNAPGDELSLSWSTRYVHEFLPSWESAGLPAAVKAAIPSQLLHAIGLTYLVRGAVTVSSTLEVQNLTDARAYDVLRVEKPGRAFYFKGTVDY
ncbi:TonB-dependent siderophore myxochelin receptor MxcH [Sorangium sp. So ce296]|uniref:TonB-dependent siderophore myxochelin receptor MxcH n=1 Tax=Sorangium sp. So ce296 TaxID=3133296 RepID=UPI003F5DEF83